MAERGATTNNAKIQQLQNKKNERTSQVELTREHRSFLQFYEEFYIITHITQHTVHLIQ